MSQVYQSEPTPTGHVIFHTSCGPIDIHLFCKECPTTCKAFLQYCTDGYYTELPFHRIMENVLIQTGFRSLPIPDTYSSKCWKENEERSVYELAARIRFNHRGQVALAQSVNIPSDEDEKRNLRGQFFITLGETPWLNNQHVIFGTMGRSPTIFNALRVGRSEVEDEEEYKPVDLDSVKVYRVEIISHIWEEEGFLQTKDIPWKAEEKKKKKKKRKRVGKKDLHVLSFGNDEDYVDDNNNDEGGMKSSHDVVADQSTFLLPTVDSDVMIKHETSPQQQKQKEIVKENVVPKATISPRDVQPAHDPTNENEPTQNATTTHTFKKKRHKKDTSTIPETKSKTTTAVETPQKDTISEVEAHRLKYISNHAKNAKIRRDGSNKAKKKHSGDDDILTKLSAFRKRVLQVKSNRDPKDDDFDDSLPSKLAKRQQKEVETNTFNPSQAQVYRGQIMDASDDEKDDLPKNTWMKSKFKCKKHVDHESKLSSSVAFAAAAADGRNMDDYVVIDEMKGRQKEYRGRYRRDGNRSGGIRRGGDRKW